MNQERHEQQEQGPDADLERHVMEAMASEREPSPERVQELEEELVGATELFDASGIESYVAGGTGLDLLDGKWDRDHQDLDLVIPQEERGRFFELMNKEEFVITDHRREPLSEEDIVEGGGENCFVHRRREDGSEEAFEVIFMPEGDEEAYAEAPVVEIGGREVRLQPPEIIMVHKLLDGRRKDLADLKEAWSVLDEGGREKVQAAVDRRDLAFQIGEESTDRVVELLGLAEKEDISRRREFFEGGAGRIRESLTGEFRESMKDIHDIRVKTADKNAFFDAIAEKYHGFVPERRAFLEQAAGFLYDGERVPDEKDFLTWAEMAVGVTDKVRDKAVYDYKEEKLWRKL